MKIPTDFNLFQRMKVEALKDFDVFVKGISVMKSLHR